MRLFQYNNARNPLWGEFVEHLVDHGRARFRCGSEHKMLNGGQVVEESRCAAPELGKYMLSGSVHDGAC